jgi:phage replication O-like protein O
MASPQLEHGYTRIANEILEALARSELSGCELRILCLIFRESYGRSRKDAELSYSELAKRVKMQRPNAMRVIAGLRGAGIILVHGGTGIQNDPSHKTRFIFRKDYHQWTGIKKRSGIQMDTSTGIQMDTSPIYSSKKEKERPPLAPLASPKRTNGGSLGFMEPIRQQKPSELPDLTAMTQRVVRSQPKPKFIRSVSEPVRKLLICFKAMQEERNVKDEALNRIYCNRFGDDADDLIELFHGDYQMAVRCLSELGGEFRAKGLTWTLSTIIRHAGEWKVKNATPKPSRPT